jgi:WD40 repeat protein
MWRARAHAETVLCASADASGTGAMSGGADGAAVRYAFDVDDDTHGVAVRIVRTHAPYANVVSSAMKQPGVSAVAIRADDKIVACGCWDGKVRVFEYKAKSKGRLLAVLKYHEDVVTDVAFAPDGSVLVSAARDGLVCLWPIFPQ